MADLPAAVFVCRHGEREDYAWANRGENWQAQAERPWDTPLTAAGHLQARAVGCAVRDVHVPALRCAPVTRIVSSPLLRCVQTACAAAEALGLTTVGIEPGLAETMGEDWYRSWGVPGADSTWGGPKHCRAGVIVNDADLDARALAPAHRCHSTPADIEALRLRCAKSDVGAAVTVSAEKAVFGGDAFQYTFKAPEAEEAQAARMRAVLDACASLKGGSTLLVSHGGPTAGLYHGVAHEKPPNCGYTGLFCYVSENDAWHAVIVADHAHLEGIDAPKCGMHDFA
eukprot:CAMPEP_0184095512 /NCGR_PEP_ID=MMETSP0974-20121125/9810_1 /TAXON_ID=483370 /ORGANISM="non described non described, Strain CCMP2097" /LENGTH=283 /DNA_ID=CAMNT_0026398321 /DNA_START=15 /DNA_END=862 /DNA_ORIENTATION=-